MCRAYYDNKVVFVFLSKIACRLDKILTSKQCSVLNEYQLPTSSNSFCKYRLPYLMNYYIATAIPSPSLDANTFHRKQCKNWVNKSIVLLFVCYYAWF